jgi:hypothetical protein
MACSRVPQVLILIADQSPCALGRLQDDLKASPWLLIGHHAFPYGL